MKCKVLAIVLLLLPLAMSAQKSNRKPAKNKAAAAAVQPVTIEEDSRIVEMRELTQRIVFVDSIVVDKQEVLSAIHLNPETGRLTDYDTFFRATGHDDNYVFLNEMGNKCYLSDDDANGRTQLFTCDLLGNEWSKPTPLKGLSGGIREANYPFMMTDGITFYFAARGEESIGGYDIFATRYDAADGRFLTPENIGMPFNSEANDYFYVIDEIANIGYFATDRRQPQGKVCVYMFIPPTSRQSYNTDNYTDAQLRRLAAISSIADTWGNGTAQQQALERLQALREASETKKGNSRRNAFSFVVNDKLTYTSPSQFQHPGSAALYRSLQSKQSEYAQLKTNLEKSRNYFARASREDKAMLRKEILASEKQEVKMRRDILQMEKQLRNLENQTIQQR